MEKPTIFNLPFELKHKIFTAKKMIKLKNDYDNIINKIYNLFETDCMNVEQYFIFIIKYDYYNEIKFIDNKPASCFFETFVKDIDDYDILLFKKQIIENKRLLKILKQIYIIEEKNIDEIDYLIDMYYMNEYFDDDSCHIITDNKILDNIFNDFIQKIKVKFEVYSNIYEKYCRILHQYINKDEIYLLIEVSKYIKEKLDIQCYLNDKLKEYAKKNNIFFDEYTYNIFLKEYEYFLLYKGDLTEFDISYLFLTKNTDELDKIRSHNFIKNRDIIETYFFN